MQGSADSLFCPLFECSFFWLLRSVRFGPSDQFLQPLSLLLPLLLLWFSPFLQFSLFWLLLSLVQIFYRLFFCWPFGPLPLDGMRLPLRWPHCVVWPLSARRLRLVQQWRRDERRAGAH